MDNMSFNLPEGSKVTIEWPDGRVVLLNSNGVAIDAQTSNDKVHAKHVSVVSDTIKAAVREAQNGNVDMMVWLQGMNFFDKDLDTHDILFDVFRNEVENNTSEE